YGDIGTSPLYAFREAFHPEYGLTPTPETVLGVLSMIVWSLVLIVSVKYIGVVVRADNRGEGGILALLALLPRDRRVLVLFALFVLGAVGLAVTGAEAPYADMGHFGRRPIRLVWFTIVLPALLLNYFGQGALVLRLPETIQNPFYMLAPRWFLYPLLAIASLA